MNIAKRFGQSMVAGATVAAASAHAAAPDLTALTGEVDFSTVGAAILVVFGAIAGVSIVMVAGRKVLSAIGGK